MTFKEYLKEPQRIGFMESFPIIETLETKTFTIDGFDQHFPKKINVSLVTVGFGENNKFQCRAVVTERISTASTRFMHGWGSYCFVEEAQFMEHAVVKFCKQNNFIICSKICSWPFAKAIITDKT